MPRTALTTWALRTAVAIVSILGAAGAASAATINVPAAAFLSGSGNYLANFGVIEGSGALTFRAPVYFPVFGETVCRLSFWAHDFDDGSVTVRLVRKRLAPSTSSSFGLAPQTMIEVSSTGSADTLRGFSTSRVLTGDDTVTAAYGYWVEIEWNDSGPIQVAGVRIMTCAP